jgi:hypothetical protein
MVTLVMHGVSQSVVEDMGGADEPQTVLDRLGPIHKARIMLALVGLLTLGLGLVALIMLGGWMVRRRARRGVAPSRAVPGSEPSAPFPRSDYLTGPRTDLDPPLHE